MIVDSLLQSLQKRINGGSSIFNIAPLKGVSRLIILKQNLRLFGTTAVSLPILRLMASTLAPSWSPGMESITISFICKAILISCILTKSVLMKSYCLLDLTKYDKTVFLDY